MAASSVSKMMRELPIGCANLRAAVLSGKFCAIPPPPHLPDPVQFWRVPTKTESDARLSFSDADAAKAQPVPGRAADASGDERVGGRTLFSATDSGFMRFHVLGLGPIGSLLAFHLRRALPAHHPISLVHRTKRQAKISRDSGSILVDYHGAALSQTGFDFTAFKPGPQPVPKLGRDGEIRLPTPDSSRKNEAKDVSHVNDEGSANQDPIESLLITTKAHQTLPALRHILPRISASTTIVLLQNGMGVYERLVQNLFPNPSHRPHFILASNTHGAWLKSRQPVHVVHAGVGRITFAIAPDPLGRNFEFGLRDEKVPKEERKLRLTDIANPPNDRDSARYLSLRNTVAALLCLTDLNTEWQTLASVQVAVRRKLVINSIVNPLTAVFGCRNGDIFHTEASKRIMHRVCMEAEAVFEAQLRADTKAAALAEGSHVTEEAATAAAAAVALPIALRAQNLESECIAVARRTKDNYSSMLADLQRGATISEVDYMNGYLLALGKTYNVQMPATATLRNLTLMRFAIPIDRQAH